MSDLRGGQNIPQTKHEQIQFYKMAKSIANKLLQENIAAKPTTKTSWETVIVENNIAQLRNLIQLINNARRPDIVDSQFHPTNVFGNPKRRLTQFKLEFARAYLMFSIARHSLHYSVVFDMYWNRDGTVGDHIDIALGEKSVKELAKYTPRIIEKLKQEAIPYLKGIEQYNSIISIAEDAIQKLEIVGETLFNLMIPPIIEGLTRQFAKVVYKRQNHPISDEEIELYISRFQSLEALITKGHWKPDIKLTAPEAIFRSKYIPHEQLHEVLEAEKLDKEVKKDTAKLLLEAQELVREYKEGDKNVEKRKRIEELLTITYLGINGPKLKDVYTEVSIEIELQFLLRRYKDDRNNIIHGDLTEFDHGWKVYTNISALYGLYKVINSYHTLHSI